MEGEYEHISKKNHLRHNAFRIRPYCLMCQYVYIFPKSVSPPVGGLFLTRMAVYTLACTCAHPQEEHVNIVAYIAFSFKRLSTALQLTCLRNTFKNKNTSKWPRIRNTAMLDSLVS